MKTGERDFICEVGRRKIQKEGKMNEIKNTRDG